MIKKMDNIVVGGVGAEIKIEIQDSVIEIGADDIFKNDSDDDDPFAVDDDDNRLHKNRPKSGEIKILRHAAKGAKFDLSEVTEKKAIIKDQNRNDFKTKVNLEKEENLVLNNKVTKRKVNIKDQNRNNFKTKVNLAKKEKLILNYTANKDLLHVSDKEKLKEAENEVNNPIDWFGRYRTIEGTSVDEDMTKVKVTRVPTSYISPSEYTQEAFDKFCCNHCPFVTKCKKFVVSHIRYKHREVTKSYQCPFCPFKSKYQLRYHIISVHKSASELEWFRCDQCDYKSKLKSTLSAHMVSHLDPCQMIDRMCKCDLCPKMYKKSDGLRRHILFVHEKHKLKKLKCTMCDYECIRSIQLKLHTTRYHSNYDELETIKCPKCSYKTKIKRNFELHTRSRHSENMIQCDKCAYQASSMDKMNLHLINHKEVKDEADLRYRCDKCDYKTYRVYSLQVHKLNHLKPEEIKYFYCYHCKFKAKRKDNLKTHILRHFKQNEVRFQCFICDFTTKKRNLLGSHLVKHKNESMRKRNQKTAVISPSVTVKQPKKEMDNRKTEITSDDERLEEAKNQEVEATPPSDAAVNELSKLKVEDFKRKRPKFEFISSMEAKKTKRE